MACRCAIRHKLASKCLQVFEAIIAKLLLVISICSIVYSDNWLPVFINFAFLFLSIFAIITYGSCYKKKEPTLVLPMLVHLSVNIFWIFIWIYASLTSITTGFLWSLSWLGGPKSSRETTSSDIMDPNYVDPNETSPETKKSIKYGIIITVASMIVLVLKIVCWIIARRTFHELRKHKCQVMAEEEQSRLSDLGAPSPPYPVVMRSPALEKKVKPSPPRYNPKEDVEEDAYAEVRRPEKQSFLPQNRSPQLSPARMESSC